jgi:hypothetical protein
MRFAGLILSALLLGALASCGGSTRYYKLAYTPGQADPLPQAKSAPAVIVHTFQDTRADRALGKASNYGGHVFFIIGTQDDIPGWVTNALATELGRAGCRASVQASDQPGACVVRGAISELDCSGILTTMRVTVQVVRDGTILLNRSFASTGEGFMTGAPVYFVNYTKLYDVTLQNLMKEIVPQVLPVLDRAP